MKRIADLSITNTESEIQIRLKNLLLVVIDKVHPGFPKKYFIKFISIQLKDRYQNRDIDNFEMAMGYALKYIFIEYSE